MEITMDNKTNNNKQNSSMFLYTALIFAVALVLIILAFFGQANISRQSENAETIAETATIAPQESEPTETAIPQQEELAKMTNAVSALSDENTALKNNLNVYERLLTANKAVTENNPEAANAALEGINVDLLTDEQKILYNQITAKINE